MRPTVYEVDTGAVGRLALVPRPRGGEGLQDELGGLRDAGFDVLVSALTDRELEQFELNDEAKVAATAGLEFIPIPMPDMGTPSDFGSAVDEIQALARAIRQRRSVAVHCRMSIGRSSLIAAGILVVLDVDAHEAFRRIAEARGTSVPETGDQRQWVEDLVVWLGTRAD
jgi:protein-tyrosine phosphatase